MTDPVDLELARYRAQADQLGSAVREALLELDRAAVADIVRACAKGDLSGLDERTVSLVAWMAVVGFFGLFEPGEG